MMRSVFLVAAFGLLVSSTPVSAQPLSDKLYDFGWNICAKAMDDDLPGVDGAGFAELADRYLEERADFCHCVAGEFRDFDADDLKLMSSGSKDGDDYLAFMATMSMTICIPEPYDGDDEYPEEELPDEDFAYDEEDVRLCNLTLDDAFAVPGLRLDEVLEGMENSGQTREDLCTCSARYFTSLGEEFAEALDDEENGSRLYFSTMGDAINTCRY